MDAEDYVYVPRISTVVPRGVHTEIAHTDSGMLAVKLLLSFAVVFCLLLLAPNVFGAAISGVSSGSFIKPTPETADVSGVGTNAFTWGTGSSGSPPNRFSFAGATIQTNSEEVFAVGTLTYFNGRTVTGTDASFVTLQVNLVLPDSRRYSVEQPLRLISTPNISDPVASADIVFLPTVVQNTSFVIDGSSYTLSILGFYKAVPAPGEKLGGDLEKFTVQEDSSTTAVLLGRVGKTCSDLTCRVPEAISDFGVCGPFFKGPKDPTWGQFGKKGARGVLVFDSGESLEIECGGDSTAGQFRMYYTSPRGVRNLVGICPFEGGCNSATFTHAGDNDGNGRPDCLLKTEWISRDYGVYNDALPNPWTSAYEPLDGKIDWAVTNFDAQSTKVDFIDYKFDHALPYPLLSRCKVDRLPESPPPVATLSIDPLLGIETERFFSKVEDQFRSQPVGDPMTETFSRRCDFSGDGVCDDQDLQIFQTFVGSCRGEGTYHPLADVDGDGCVTSVDQKYLFPKAIAVSVKYGSGVAPIKTAINGVVPVFVLSTRDFDARTADPLSMRFGRKGAVEAHKQGHLEDVNGDGNLDLVLHFRTQDSGILAGDTSACLSGRAFEGYPIGGCAAIRTVGPSR